MSRLVRRGFTLIELMLVVTIVGVLSTLALYGVRRYMLHSKTAEARNALGQMGKDASSSYSRDSMASSPLSVGNASPVVHNLCESASAPVPSSITLVKGQKYQSGPTEWGVDSSKKGFLCMHFSMSDAQYYQYDYRGVTGASGAFTAIASGDLDGDGNTSTFKLYGAIVSGIVAVSPNLDELDPEE